MTVVVRPEILTSLASVREDVQRHVSELDRYRALKAIEKTIADFPDLDDLNRSLSDLREHMQRQLDDTREFRALRAVEKIMPELTEVLAFLSERSGGILVAENSGAANPDHAPSEETADDRTSPQSDEDVIVPAVESAAQAVLVQEAARPEQEPQHAIADPVDPGDAAAPANDIGSSGGSPPTTISYGIAQFLNPDEAPEQPAVAQTGSDEEGLAQFRAPPSQEGRAA